MRDHLPILIWAVPLLAAPLLLLAANFSLWLTRVLAFLALASGFALSLLSFPRVLQEGSWHYFLGGWPPPWGLELSLTPLTCLFLFFLWALSGMVLFHARDFGREDSPRDFRGGLFDLFLLLLTVSLAVMLLNRDLFTLYVLQEISILSAGGLLLVTEKRGVRAGFSFILWGSVGASFYLAGVGYLYAATGTTHLGDLLAQLFIGKHFALLQAAGFFILAGWAFFILFPLPFLGTPFFGGISIPLLAFFSSAFARVGAFLLFLFLFFGLAVPDFTPSSWARGLEHLATLCFLSGFVLAIRQKTLRNLLGVLSLAQLGYLFAGFCLGNKAALTGVALELLGQMPVLAGLFFILGRLEKDKAVSQVAGLEDLAREKPVLSLALVVLAASVAGIPPTAGSFGKWFLLQGALERKDWFLVAALALTVLFNFACFLRLVWRIYNKGIHEEVERGPSRERWLSDIPAILLAACVLALGLFHQAVLRDVVEPSLPKAFLSAPIPNVPFLGKEME